MTSISFPQLALPILGSQRQWSPFESSSSVGIHSSSTVLISASSAIMVVWIRCHILPRTDSLKTWKR